jgi:hypothetical protein
MVKEIKYTSIRRVLDELHDEALMDDLTLEQAVRYTLRFIGKFGLPKMYEDKKGYVDIKDYRGMLPCDLISIDQVRDTKTGICLRSMTDNFGPEPFLPKGIYMPFRYEEFTFKTQGRVIYTSFPEGRVELAYKSIPVDEDGFPLLMDNEVYLDALESYISKRVIRNKFRKGDINAAVYEDAQREYSWNAGELEAELLIPSQSEMESITRMVNTLIPQVRHFDNGFRDMGNREYIKNH